MAILKIQSDIVGTEQAQQMRMFGLDAVCYKDVGDFIESIPEGDNDIEVRIHCNGGSVSEGWAIYDGLRATGKNITAIVDGKAASMATIVMMAAPKERRKAYENATILIHDPYIDGSNFDVLTAKRLRLMADDMESEQRRMVDLYAERCGCSREEIAAEMEKNMPMTASRALELGIIGEIIPPMSARGTDRMFNQNRTAMNETQEVKTSLVDKILAKFGLKDLDEVEATIDGIDIEGKDDGAAEAVALELNTEDGGTLTVERESGEPQIGDKAQPDGEHKMPDGRTIVVEEGVITDIRTEDTEQEEAAPDEAEALRARVEELEKELAEARKMAKSKEDMRILNAVRMAGGESVLKNFTSSYTPDTRHRDGKDAKMKAESRGEYSPIRAEIEARKKGEWKKK